MRSQTIRRQKLQRVALVAFAATITWVMGVRAPKAWAASFSDIELQGMGRATLTIEQLEPTPPEGPAIVNEVFSRMIYSSELSSFTRGLYVRASFTLPSTRETAVLVVDVDRSRGQKAWEASEQKMRARFYTLATRDAKAPSFDGVAIDGTIELEAAVVGAKRAGFRLEGQLTVRDRGADNVAHTADDGAFEIALELESVPPPEEIAGQPVPDPPRPSGGVCDPVWCWQDDGYYDGYWYGPGCGDAEIGYETTDSGCESDSVDDTPIEDPDGVYDPYDPYTGTGDTEGGCDGSSDTSSDASSSSGCEGSDDTSGTSSNGCEGTDTTSDSSSGGCDDSSSSSGSGCDDSGSSGSGCSDSGSSSSCGSGCEGDTLQRAPVQGDRVLEGGLGWVSIGLFVSAVGAAIRRRRGD